MSCSIVVGQQFTLEDVLDTQSLIAFKSVYGKEGPQTYAIYDFKDNGGDHKHITMVYSVVDGITEDVLASAELHFNENGPAFRKQELGLAVKLGEEVAQPVLSSGPVLTQGRYGTSPNVTENPTPHQEGTPSGSALRARQSSGCYKFCNYNDHCVNQACRRCLHLRHDNCPYHKTCRPN